MQPSLHTGENRASFGARFIADRDDIREHLPGFEHVEDGFRFVARNVDPHFLHCLHNDWVEPTRFEAGTLGFKLLRADLVEKRLSHLAARAVVNADEQHLLLHIARSIR